MIVAWMAHNRCYVIKHKLLSLQSKYGIEDGDLVPNPMSYREYLRMMLKRMTWGEDVVLYSLATLFDLRITVVNSSALEEYRYRHNLPLHHVDVVLIYNGRNHYLFAGKWTLVHMLDENTVCMYIDGRLYQKLKVGVMSVDVCAVISIKLDAVMDISTLVGRLWVQTEKRFLLDFSSGRLYYVSNKWDKSNGCLYCFYFQYHWTTITRRW